jgi:hypothetical protein
MKLHLKWREVAATKTLATEQHLEEAVDEIARGARAMGHRHLVEFRAENGNTLSIALGGEETVVIFGCPHNDPPYYTLRGTDTTLDPLFDCHSFGQHVVELPRWFVIPIEEGKRAIRAFAASGERPQWGSWDET